MKKHIFNILLKDIEKLLSTYLNINIKIILVDNKLTSPFYYYCIVSKSSDIIYDSLDDQDPFNTEEDALKNAIVYSLTKYNINQSV